MFLHDLIDGIVVGGRTLSSEERTLVDADAMHLGFFKGVTFAGFVARLQQQVTLGRPRRTDLRLLPTVALE